MAVEVNAMANYYVPYPDSRYWYNPNNDKPPSDIGHRYQWLTVRNSYSSNRLKSFEPYCSPQYQHPAFYFWAVHNKLRILGTDVELQMDSKWDDQQLAVAHRALGADWNKEAIHEIYTFLRVQEFPSYYKALLSFKWFTGLLFFPLFDQYDRISLIDGKLFAVYQSQQTFKPLNGFGITYTLLTKDIVDAEIKYLKGKPAINDKISSTLAKHLVKMHQKDSYANTSVEPRVANYREGFLKYIPVLNGAELHFMNFPLSCMFPPLGRLPKTMVISNELEDMLLTLTDGDFDRLDTLAEFLARIYCSTVPSKYLWYIHGNDAPFLRWLFQLIGVQPDSTAYEPGNQQKKLIAYGRYLAAPIQINYVPSYTKLEHKKLKRYINGGSILKTNDPYQMKATFDYYPTVIFAFDGDKIDKTSVFESLPWKEINVPVDWSAAGLSDIDNQWLKTCLVARGLQIIDGIEGLTQESKQTDLAQLIRQFADKFCESKPGSFTSGKDFRKSFSRYINTLPYSVDLPGSTKLSLAVKECTGWMYDSLKSHTTMGFVGIHLNEDKLSAALAENEARKEQIQQERTARSFHDCLNEITSLVLWPN